MSVFQASESSRPRVCGKAFYRGAEKLSIRGVTYGPLTADADGGFEPGTAERDFVAMADVGVNAIRLYAPPPRWLLDLAAAHGLLVMVGIAWEQHVAFLEHSQRIEETVRRTVAQCAGHPAVLCYAIGNEIPASIVRWQGRRQTERFLIRMARAARDEDPQGLLTYVNFPPTEYLRAAAFDFVSFNVYLERPDQLERYLARLQNLADDRPLVIAELGLDSRRNGEREQALSLSLQVRASRRAGCAGAFVFAWTDQWSRGGQEILDWDFGLTSRSRRAKPALAAVGKAFADDIGDVQERQCATRISVVVCTHNGARTIDDCLCAAANLRYADYEVIVVSDGSTDETVAIASSYPGVRVIETPPRGLAAARNTGMEAATGKVVAYIDDDAIPDPDWLSYLAKSFAPGTHAAVGGPNIPPPGSGKVAQCVANAPGGPTHVLLSDTDAEHIPGCNMAIDRHALQAIGGFDPAFRAAGDDVDVCWRLLDSGRAIAFNPGAVVYHHRRASVRGYLRQQRGYGRAEALLERKYPDRYSSAGHVAWNGRLYGNGAAQHRGGWRWRVYYGGWGTAYFQSLYGPRKGLLESLPLMPEWYLAIAGLALLSAAGAIWNPLLAAIPLLILAVGGLIVDATLGAARARFQTNRATARLRVLTAFLYLSQPLARLYGRLVCGLSPWRRRGPLIVSPPWSFDQAYWCEAWRGPEERVAALIRALRSTGVAVRSGGDWDRWDLQVRGGLLGIAYLRLAIEEHGGGQQLVRVRVWPKPRLAAAISIVVFACLTSAAALSDGDAATAVLAVLTGAFVLRTTYECARACAMPRWALPQVIHSAEDELLDSESREESIRRGVPERLGLRDGPMRPRIAYGSRETAHRAALQVVEAAADNQPGNRR